MSDDDDDLTPEQRRELCKKLPVIDFMEDHSDAPRSKSEMRRIKTMKEADMTSSDNPKIERLKNSK